MRTADFDFTVPYQLIALEPIMPRDAARMLVVDPGAEPSLRDASVAGLAHELSPDDLLVVNNTRVIPAALSGLRQRPSDAAAPGVRIHVNLVRRTAPNTWLAFAKPGRKLAVGDRLQFIARDAPTPISGISDTLVATVQDKQDDGLSALAFDLSGADLDAAIAATGAMPLPPYIQSRRPADARDHATYQTVYAARDGAVASPTAGLHFTDDVFAALAARSINRTELTLHVGAGTFLPVKTEDVADHQMHSEWFEITPETAEAIAETRARGGRVIAVGTTVLRALESAVDADGIVHPHAGDTDIFITPGYRFRAVDALMTNFHLPRSTLFMLVAAFAGLKTMQAAYAHAIAERYRFYSYGDSTLLFRAKAEA
ncbi:MAG: tRNA preQ1(34) S-adenosylmethionine ribosyltransferase-isomerase QueA [Pseudomonadota bacterium]